MVRLSEVAYIEMGQSPPSSVVFESSESGVAFLQGNAEFTDRYPRARQHCTKPPKIAEAADALISVRAPVGAINKADQRYCIGRGLAAVRFTGVDPAFGFHALSFYSRSLRRVAQGTTFEAIGGADLREMDFPLCSRPEQRGIAAILDTLDEVIRKTEDLIAKLKQIKQGLLHDLLTRGVEESGELRPSPDDAPQLYKDSPLGKVPSEWNVESIRSVSRGPGCYGSGAAALDYDPSLPRYVRITDITEDGRLSGATEASIRTIDADPYMLSEGDLLFARSGATVGKTHLYRPSDGPCAHAGYVIKYAIDTARAIPAYVFSWTQSPAFWRWIGQTLRQGAQPNINEKEYGGHLLALPPLAEQGRIVALLEAVTRRLAAELHEAEKLRVVKSGLLDDLLTGRVRVSVSAKTGA